ncbi:MAG: cysteine-rich small domain-containing protein [Candidatus Bathyarchaeota archaeon]
MASVKAGKITGPNTKCEYYPCHFEGQDCTWCFCPFYPCGDCSVGGEWIVSSNFKGKVWSCTNCKWIHKPEVAGEVLKEISQLVGRFSSANEVLKERLFEVFLHVRARLPP